MDAAFQAYDLIGVPVYVVRADSGRDPLSPDFVPVYFNAALRDILDLGGNEPTALTEGLPAAAASKLQALNRACWSAGSTTAETDIELASGQTLVVTAQLRRCRLNDADHIVVSLSDNTQHRQTEDRLAAVMRFANVGILVSEIKSPDNAPIIMSNPALERLLGFKEGESLGRNYYDLVMPDEQSLAAQNLSILMNDHSALIESLRTYRHCDGSAVKAGMASSIFVDPHTGQRMGIVTIRDRAIEIATEQKLISRERLGRQILDDLPIWVSMTDRDNNFIFLNRRALEQIGLPETELIGQSVTKAAPPESHQHILAVNARVLAGESITLQHNPVPLTNAPQANQLYSKLPMLDGDTIVGVLTVYVDVTETNRLRAELATVAQSFKELFASAPIGIARTNEDGIILDANDAYLKLTGFSPTDIGKSSFWDITPEDSRDIELNALNSRGPQGQLDPFVKQYRRRDGSRIDVVVSGVWEQRHADGLSSWAFVQDVTRLMDVERLLRERERKLADLLELTGDWFWELDANNVLVDLTGNYDSSLPGGAQSQVGTRQLSDHERIARGAEDWDRLLRAINKRQPFRELVLRYDWPTIGVRYLRMSGTPIFDESGGFRGYRGASTNITQTRAASIALVEREAALSESEARLRAILHAAGDAIVTFNLRGQVLDANPAASQLFAAGGDTVGEVAKIMPNLRLGDLDPFGPVTLQLRGRRRDGTEFPAEASIAPVRRAGEILFTAIVRDVTERQRQEAELQRAVVRAEEASQTKTRFLANMSHELRTPLNAIIGFSEIMMHQLLGAIGSPRYIEYSGDIHRSAKHLLDIINDMIDMSRIEVGRYDLLIAPFDVALAVNECIAMIRPQASRKNIRLEADINLDPAPFSADERAFRQVLINLTSNATKFTGQDGTIRVAVTRPAGGALTLEVADNGIGIDASRIPRLFEPFQAADATLARVHGGTGLGLSICKSLVELHGGSIAIASSKGAGTTVTVVLPDHRGAAQSGP